MASASASVNSLSYTARYAMLTTIGSLCRLPVNRSIMCSNASRNRRAPTATSASLPLPACRASSDGESCANRAGTLWCPRCHNRGGCPWPYRRGLQSAVVCNILYFERRKEKP